MKSLLPRWSKWLPWYLFKSPQRKVGLASSWLTEIKGKLSLFRNIYIRANRELRPVSICTGLKDRTDNYLNFVLKSVMEMKHPELIELSIYDLGSNDIHKLEEYIRKKWKGKLVFHSEEHRFERSYSFNKAIGQAGNELFFVSDADMQLPENLVELCNKYVHSNTVWFPICYSLNENKPAIVSPGNGEWRNAGKGMFAATKSQFTKVGKYDETFRDWGEEDWDLWLRFYKNGIYPARTKCQGLFHHYHPSVSGSSSSKN